MTAVLFIVETSEGLLSKVDVNLEDAHGLAKPTIQMSLSDRADELAEERF